MSYTLSEADAVQVIARIRAHIRTYCTQHHLTYTVFGKSEGLDSSVIAGLLSDIPGIRPVGVIIPIETRPDICSQARDVLDHYHIPAVQVDLSQQYLSVRDAFYQSGSLVSQLREVVSGDQSTTRRLDDIEKLACGNIKVRLRMITLYHVAQLLGGLVVSTDNYSEYWMGFWTICGDVGDLSPIQTIFKGNELYTIGKVLGLPEQALNAIPSDGLGITKNGYDEDQLGFPYAQLDRVILRLLRSRDHLTQQDGEAQVIDRIVTELGFPRERVQGVADRLAATEFKRHWPVMFTREEIGLPPLYEIED